MMSQLEEHARRLTNELQSKFEGQFNLTCHKWGSSEELTDLLLKDAKFGVMGILHLEMANGDLLYLSVHDSVEDAIRQNPEAKTLIIAGRATYLGIGDAEAGLKLFDLRGFQAPERLQ